MIVARPTTPFADQKPGTSGLRKKVRDFARPNYAENFIQSMFDTLPDRAGATLVIGGDGRFHNGAVIQQAIRIAAANGFARLVVGRAGLLSTPAASHLIRLRGAIGGLILSASHNPGGPEGDFGIKFNIASGGPAPERVTEAVFARSREIDRWLTLDVPDIDLDKTGELPLGETIVEIVDPVADYAALMERLFDFDAIRAAIAKGLRLRFDAMHAVTGPYAIEIFERRLGFPAGTVLNAVPREDFGGCHPDPNPVYAAELCALMASPDAPDLGAASDGDGDRNMIVGREGIVSPSDSLAILAANAHLTPGYAKGLTGVARSMPTSTAVDRVATALDIPCFETPTGWKFFAELLEAGRITLCGEESAGTGSAHVREKDGLWAVLLWLNILAVRGEPVDAITRAHWARFGRTYYARHDYEAIPIAAATSVIEGLRARLASLPGQRFGVLTVAQANDFTYVSPLDGSTSANQGLRILFEGGARLVFRLSGTGTEGATLRVYLEHHEPAGGNLDRDPSEMLAPLAEAAEAIADIARHTGRAAPDLIA